MAKNEHLVSGQWAEDAACFYLQNKGFEILHRNWRYKKSEIDVIIKTKRGAAFVEVKYRKTSFFGEPDIAVTAQKINKMQEAAQGFMEQFPAIEEMRFDILSIAGPQNNAQIHYFEDAFFPNNFD